MRKSVHVYMGGGREREREDKSGVLYWLFECCIKLKTEKEIETERDAR